MKKFLAVLDARNKEFLRDRGSLGWNIAFPIIILLGFSFIFGSRGQDVFKVAVLDPEARWTLDFLTTEHIQFVAVEDRQATLDKVARHQFDMAIDPTGYQYWINSSSAKGSLLEKLLAGSEGGDGFARGTVEGKEVRYVDWLLPGLLGMNMMFSCLLGVGYVIVRYRKNGVLRRLKATPLSAFEFLSAQVVSRMLMVLFMSAVVFVGADLFLGFEMVGSYFDLLIVFILGAASLVSVGLVFSARTASEELAGGLLNLIAFPMMILSGVWFSLDGAPGWVQNVAQIFPLTHLTSAARAVMIDGARLADVVPSLTVLAAVSLVFTTIGSALFRWE